MKNKILLTLFLLFASCTKQDVYEFEKTISINGFSWRLEARFQIIEEEGLTLYDFKTETPDKNRILRTIKFYDNKNFLLFRTDTNSFFSDRDDFTYEGKTRVATRSLLEKVHYIKFDAY